VARLARGQEYSTIQQIDGDRAIIQQWRYGEMIESYAEVKIESNVGRQASEDKEQ